MNLTQLSFRTSDSRRQNAGSLTRTALRARRYLASIMTIGLLAVVGCDGSSHNSMVVAESPDAIALNPSTDVQLEEGSQRSFSVVDASRSGRPEIAATSITWSTGDSSVATVDRGLVTARSMGETVLTARTRDGLEITTNIRVTRTAVLLEAVEGSLEREATVGDALSEPVVARVLSANGRPVAGASVRFNVTSSSGHVSPVLVESDEDGYARTHWTLGTRAGEQAVSMRLLGSAPVTRSVIARALPGPAEDVKITPAEIMLRPGGTFWFMAQAVDAFGNSLGNVPVTWSTSDPQVASIDEDGRLIGLTAGSTTVEAHAETLAGGTMGAMVVAQLAASSSRGRGNAKVKVEDRESGTGVEATIAIMDGDGQTGTVGQTLPASLEIQVTDATGTPIRQTDVTWSVTGGSGTFDQQVTRTDGRGRARTDLTLGTNPGPVTMKADLGDLGSVVLRATAVAGSIAQLRVRPSSHKMKKDESFHFTVSATDEYGNEIAAGDPTWSVQDLQVASVNGNGDVRGNAPGSTNVRAEIEGVSDLSAVTVEGATNNGDDGSPPSGDDEDASGESGTDAIVSVRASTDEVSFTALGSEATLSAVALDGTGKTVPGVSFEWSSSDPGVASVSKEGRVVAQGIGIAMIAAGATCCDTVTADTVYVSVNQTVATVSIDPASVTLDEGANRALAAKALDANGREIAGADFSWTSSDTGVATVSTSGQVTAVSEGTTTIVAKHSGVENLSSVQVRNGDSDGAKPFHSEDFSGYASVDDYLGTLNHRGWVRNEGYLSLASDGHGGSDQSLRITFPDATGRGGSGSDGRCANVTAGIDYDIRPHFDTAQKEIWAEVWVKFSSNWTTEWPAEWNCSPVNPDYKLIFGLVFGGSRFTVLNGSGPDNWTFGTPTGGNNPPRFYTKVSGAPDFWNDEWFRVRMHMRASSEEGAEDGLYRVWVNDELYADSGAHEINISEIWGLSLGRNRNHGASEDMDVSFGRLDLWNQNPGW